MPPAGAVQILPGTTHRRGTPPAVVETDARTWLSLACGLLTWDEAVAASWVMAESGDPHVQTLTSPSGKTLRILERGEGINYTAGEGNPIEIMDMSFGVQLASLRELLTHEGELAPGLHDLPREADDAVAAAALGALSLS